MILEYTGLYSFRKGFLYAEEIATAVIFDPLFYRSGSRVLARWGKVFSRTAGWFLLGYLAWLDCSHFFNLEHLQPGAQNL